MAAIERNRISSAVLSSFVVVTAGALLIGAVGGYLVRGLNMPTSAPASPVTHQPVKPAAQLPGWVQEYTEPLPASQFKVDRFIESLSYAPHADLPGWVQNYLTPAQAPQFKVDQLIESLSNARAADLPSGNANTASLVEGHSTAYVQGGRPAIVYTPEPPRIYVQGGRPQIVYDEVARLATK
jgi:hypothetical protein